MVTTNKEDNMRKEHMLGIFAILLCHWNAIFAQVLTKQTAYSIQQNPLSIGGSVGYGRNLVGSGIGDYPLFNLFIDIPIGNRAALQARTEYFQGKTRSPYEIFEYKDTE